MTSSWKQATCAAGLLFLVLFFTVSCKPEFPRNTTPQTGAINAPQPTPTTSVSVLPTPTPVLPLPTPLPTPWPPDFTPSPEPTPSPTPEGIPYIITDPVNHFTMTVLPGWYAYTPDAKAVGGVTSISSYDLHLIDSPPPDSKSIQITVGQPDAKQSFEQWLLDQRARETSPDYGAGGVILTNPQPYTLGHYTGVTYTATDSFSNGSATIIYLPMSDGRIVGIGVSPIDAITSSDVLSMLSTLDVLPVTAP